MNFKIGDVIKPKEPIGIEEWYDVKYRIVDIQEEGKYPIVVLEVLIDDKTVEEIKEEAEHDIDVNFEGWPGWVEYEVKVNVNKRYVEYAFDEDEWELVRG